MSAVMVVKNEFRTAPAKLHAAKGAAEQRAADDIARQAQGHVRVRTGQTRRSIRAEGDSVSAGGASLFLEFGTSKMPAYPFFLAAVEAARPRFEAHLLAALRDIG